MVKPTERSQHLEGAAVKDGNCPLYQRQGGKRMHGMSPHKVPNKLAKGRFQSGRVVRHHL